jgi:hypothetical protein
LVYSTIIVARDREGDAWQGARTAISGKDLENERLSIDAGEKIA